MKKHFTEEVIQIANKHMKRYLTSSVTREMQTKTTMGYHCASVRMAKLK